MVSGYLVILKTKEWDKYIRIKSKTLNNYWYLFFLKNIEIWNNFLYLDSDGQSFYDLFINRLLLNLRNYGYKHMNEDEFCWVGKWDLPDSFEKHVLEVI